MTKNVEGLRNLDYVYCAENPNQEQAGVFESAAGQTVWRGSVTLRDTAAIAEAASAGTT